MNPDRVLENFDKVQKMNTCDFDLAIILIFYFSAF
jgi:hypothetical protein